MQQKRIHLQSKREEINSLKKAVHADELNILYEARIQRVEKEKASLEKENIKAEIEIEHLKSCLKDKEKIAALVMDKNEKLTDKNAELKEIVNTHRREESERANQARINQMQAEMSKKEATIQELKDSGAGENLRSLTERQRQLEQMMLYRAV